MAACKLIASTASLPQTQTPQHLHAKLKMGWLEITTETKNSRTPLQQVYFPAPCE